MTAATSVGFRRLRVMRRNRCRASTTLNSLNDEPKASLPGEYVVYDEAARFLDYTEKYASTGHVKFVVPAPLSKSMTTKIQGMAIRAFQSVDGSGLARVDFFLTRDGGDLVVLVELSVLKIHSSQLSAISDQL